MANPWDSDPVVSPLDAALSLEGVTGRQADLARSIYQQESSSGRNTNTSNAGAVGGMQVMPTTFAGVADKEWDINDPVQNARAGIRYINQLWNSTGGDPRLTAIGYYGGPGAITKARQGVAVSDSRNPNAPNTLQYGDSVLARLGNAVANAVIPAAQADTLTNQPWLQDAAVDQSKDGKPAAEGRWLPDGGYSIDIRPGNTDQDVPWAKDQPVKQPDQKAPEKSVAQQVGETVLEAPRQAGLTIRYGLEGLGQAADIFTEPIRQLVVNPLARLVGLPEAQPSSTLASMVADATGLPAPKNADERVVGDITRLMAGAGGVAGGSGALSRGASGIVQDALQGVAANPLQQIISGAGAGALGGSVREAGGNPLAQLAAGAVGGIAAPASVGGLRSIMRPAARFVENRLPIISPVSDENVDRALKAALAQDGVDWESIPARTMQSLRDEAATALRQGGDLSPAAVGRLAAFRQVEGATPMRGMISQDPNQVSREQNLAKIGANSSDASLQSLPRIQNANNNALIRALDNLSAGQTDDAYTTGQRAIDALSGRVNSQQTNVDRLYSQARDNAGRSFPLDNAAFTNRAANLLEDNLVSASLPTDIRNLLNKIAGNEMPFTVDVAEQLKTRIGRLQRNTNDGSTRYALGLVRQALDETPIRGLGEQASAPGARAVNPQNLPATPGNPSLGEDAVAAFNEARAAHRSLRQEIESSTALKALDDGKIKPDDFVSKFVLGASAQDAQKLSTLLEVYPAVRESVKGSIVQQLKDAALSKASNEFGKFSATAYGRALAKIGDQKLSAFFSPDEISQLHAIERVARSMTNQPVGSAVNNSNTSAATIGRVLDAIGSAGRAFRLLGVGDQVNAIQNILGTRRASNFTPGLMRPATATPLRDRLLPLGVAGSVFATTPGREDRRRD